MNDIINYINKWILAMHYNVYLRIKISQSRRLSPFYGS